MFMYNRGEGMTAGSNQRACLDIDSCVYFSSLRESILSDLLLLAPPLKDMIVYISEHVTPVYEYQ